jgi:hypothetical protein
MRAKQRRIARPLATIAATAALAATLPMAAANAETYYGPYQDQGTCNYWRHAVEQGNPPYRTEPCFYTQLGGRPWGWYFKVYN